MPQLISFTDKGLFCEAGNFYIDPWKPVERAVITHGHSDHARFGNKYYLCHQFYQTHSCNCDWAIIIIKQQNGMKRLI